MADPTIVPHGKPAWTREADIGYYDGTVDKEDNATENPEPYAVSCWRELHAMRGSAYTTKPSTLVDAENLALARHFAAVWYRTPEKLRANAVPSRADERLEYWATVLGVSCRATDPRWLMRQRCAAHFQSAGDPTQDNVEAALSTLLGSAFVQLNFYTGADLATPPDGTYWKGGDAGPAAYNLGGGTWMSSRCHLHVQVTQPSNMPDWQFLDMMDMQLFQLLDRMLPAYATFGWSTGDGFLVDISRIGFDGLAD